MTLAHDTKIRVAVGGTAICSALCLLALVVLFVVTKNTGDNVNSGVAILQAQDESQALSACRASLKARLVDAPTARAWQPLALYGSESDEFREAAASIRAKDYTDLLELAERDPDKFLKDCEPPPVTCASFDGPIKEGDPNYDPGLDKDHDGIACE